MDRRIETLKLQEKLDAKFVFEEIRSIIIFDDLPENKLIKYTRRRKKTVINIFSVN